MDQTPQSEFRPERLAESPGAPVRFELRPAEIPTPITFREGGRKFRVVHVFRVPTFEDWLEYELGLQRSAEIVGDATRLDRREAEAAETIWNRVVLRVEGYRLQPSAFRPGSALAVASARADNLAGDPPAAGALPGKAEGGNTDLLSAFPESWREKVDVLHKIAAVRLLAQVYVAEPDSAGADDGDYLFDPDCVEVHLVAARGGMECNGLAHVLRRPTAREQKEFSRVVSSALYVRGSRTEKSLLPSRLREFVKFYDSLIQEVRGYVAEGVPAGREDAVKFMDALHKQTAVSALFSFEDSA